VVVREYGFYTDLYACVSKKINVLFDYVISTFS